VIDEATRKKAEECIEAEDGATHRFKGAWQPSPKFPHSIEFSGNALSPSQLS
jgi:hypothetical protein